MNSSMLVVPDGSNLGASMHTLEKGEKGLLVQASTTAGFLISPGSVASKPLSPKQK